MARRSLAYFKNEIAYVGTIYKGAGKITAYPITDNGIELKHPLGISLLENFGRYMTKEFLYTTKDSSRFKELEKDLQDAIYELDDAVRGTKIA